MMAGSESSALVQPRVDKVKIVHAGEDNDLTIRPLALILEEQLKLGEQVEFVRKFKQDTNITNYIANCICSESGEEKMVLVVSAKLNSAMSQNPEAAERIKNKILSPDNNGSNLALVSPGNTSMLWDKQYINLSNYVAKIEDGAVAEAIFKQWFGPHARLSSQAEVSMTGIVTSSAAPEVYAPSKVKIIHAMMNSPDDKHFRNSLASAIDDIANPEETTHSRLRFMIDRTVAQTVVEDLEKFQRCSLSCKGNAVVIWCPHMLSSLQQDASAKDKVIDILCRDSSQRKRFAHLLLGVSKQDMAVFSHQFLEFLLHHGHFEEVEQPVRNLSSADYERFASTFLTIWAGLKVRVPKNPEESLDPTMNSLENFPNDGLNQLQPDQNKAGDRLVMNDASISKREANRTKQKGQALGDFDNHPNGRLVTSNGSWDPQIHKAMNNSREFQSDGISQPPEPWSYHTLHGPSLVDSTSNLDAAPVRQPVPNPEGHNRMTAGSISSVSVNSETGPKAMCLKTFPLTSELQERAAVSLPASGGELRVANPQQPHRRKPEDCSGMNRVAASGFTSHSMSVTTSRPDSSIGQGGTEQQLASGVSLNVSGDSMGVPVGSFMGQHGVYSSVRDNPIRKASDAEVVTSEVNLQLDEALDDLCTPFQSLGPASTVPDGARRSLDGSRSLTSTQLNYTGMRSMPEGSNPMFNVNASMCGSVSLPYAGATSNIEQYGHTNGSSSALASLGSSSQQRSQDMFLSELDPTFVRGLKVRLDPLKQAINDWQELAYNFGVPNEEITFWKSLKSDSSPFEQLLTWLKANKHHLTVRDLKEGLKKIVRLDVLKYLEDIGY